MTASSEKRWEKEIVLTKGMAIKKRPLNGSLFVFVRQSTSALAAQKFPVVTRLGSFSIALFCHLRGTRLVFALEGCTTAFAFYGHVI
jgi:hypothetical protein